MASAPQPQLPLFYNDLAPLNSRDHANFKAQTLDRAPWAAKQHAVPLTTDEFALALRNFPIVFSSGDEPVPLALMGLNEGINVYLGEDGMVQEDIYLPAYIRRYPYMLARLDPNSETMSLCFDPSSGLIEENGEGKALFEGDEPTQETKDLLQFCQNFEEAGMRTQQFVEELRNAELLMEGEVSIQRPEQPDQPYVYRGFQMVDQNKLRELRGDKLRTWNQNGILPLIYAHLFSLDLMRVIFAKQILQGKGPVADAIAAEAKTAETAA
jgi:hypothetical protein